MVGRSEEDRQMWLYIQTWLPFLSIILTAAICFGVASFVMGQAKSGTGHFLMTLAVARLKILDDVSNFIQTRMRDRLRLTTTGRPSPRSERVRGQATAVSWRLTNAMYAYA
jgi:hypothetical protein